MELIKPVSGTTQIPLLTPLFQQCCEELSKIAKENGINLKAYNDKGLQKFSSLPLEHQTNIIDAVRAYVIQLNSAVRENIDLIDSDNRKHAWWAMAQMGLRPPSDLFNVLTHSDVIEIYNSESIQIFRSFEMFKYLSYSLSEIFSHDWVELYSRDEFVFNRMLKLVEDALSGKIRGITHSRLPPHIVEEKFSEHKRWAKMEHILVCPLYTSNGSVGGLISTFQVLDHGNKV